MDEAKGVPATAGIRATPDNVKVGSVLHRVSDGREYRVCRWVEEACLWSARRIPDDGGVDGGITLRELHAGSWTLLNPEPAPVPDSVVMVGDVRLMLCGVEYTVLSIGEAMTRIKMPEREDSWPNEHCQRDRLIRRGPGESADAAQQGVVHVRSPHGERLVWCKAVENGLKWADNPEQGTCPACREKMAEGCPFGDHRGFCTHPDCKAHKPTEPPAVKVGQVWEWCGVSDWTVGKDEGTLVRLDRGGQVMRRFEKVKLQREGRLVRDVEEDTTVDEYINSRNPAQTEPMISRAEHKLLLKEAEARGYQRGLNDGASHAWEATAMYRGRLAGDLRATREAIRAEPTGDPPGFDSLTDDEGLL